MRRLLAFVLVLSTAVCGACTETGSETGAEPKTVSGPVRFYREHVRVDASEGRTRVVGHYFFRNASDGPTTVSMSYPFPVDLHHARPFSVAMWLRRGAEFRPLGFHHESDSVRWKMSFAPREEHEVLVEYVQEVSRKHAVYIVTTIGRWGEPIELAEFEFRVPASLQEVELSFEPDAVEDRGDTVVYLFRQTDFMPERDLEIWWR
ncbi:MAG: DUF4424 family protein [Candidatus Eisenbacteria bacterium]